MKKTHLIVFLVIICTTQALAQPPNVIKTIEKNNQFAFELYQFLPKDNDNFVIAPYSISSSMSMLFVGASGPAKKEIFDYIHLLPRDSSVNKSFLFLNKEIQKRNLSDIDILINNTMWVNDSCRIFPAFEKQLKIYHQTNIQRAHFTDAPLAAKSINQTAKKASRMQIMDLVAASELSDSTRILMTSAIYFNGKWNVPFDSEFTGRDIFHVNQQKQVSLDYMNAVAYFSYAETDFLKVIDIPYGNKELAMTILLPKKIEDFQKLEEQLSDINFNFWTSNMYVRQVNIKLPKFNFSSGYSLKPIMQTMGIQTLFTPEANFIKMNGKKGLYLSDFIQKIKIIAQENSHQFEGAAYVNLNDYDPEVADVINFKADRPYIFVIRDLTNKSVLFVGRVTDPSKSNSF